MWNFIIVKIRIKKKKGDSREFLTKLNTFIFIHENISTHFLNFFFLDFLIMHLIIIIESVFKLLNI